MSSSGKPSRANPPRLRLRVTATAEAILRSGHPWLFDGSIKEQNREGKTGELAVIYDRRDRFLAVGLFDVNSPIRVRILHTGKPRTLDADWWRGRLNTALERRRGLFDEQTTSFRCINGESDGWPGLVLDRYGETFVLKLYTAAWLPRLNEMTGLIADFTSAERVVLRLGKNIQNAAKAQYSFIDGQMIHGPPLDGPITFLESGIRFEADVLRGQKTGFFLDQRENRRIVESLTSGRAVLNAFSFSGAFSVYAARGGAKSATDLDISPHALAAARRNFQLNGSIPAVEKCVHKTVQADAFAWLENASPKQFDLAILDPPSLAKRESERAGAIRAYGRLAELGVRSLRARGVLLAASCSAHVSADEFFHAVRQSVAKSRRKFTELQTARHAPDHPATFKEAEYLKAIYLKLE